MIARSQVELDVLLARIGEVARLLPALTARNGVQERRRLVAAVERGQAAVPCFRTERRQLGVGVFRLVDRARELAEASAVPELYLARLEELELELALIDALGDARRVRPMAARRFGTGAQVLRHADGDVTLRRVADAILESVAPSREEPTVPASGRPGELSLEALVRAVAVACGIEIEVRVEPRLVANAAAGDRVVFLADRRFGAREARRLALHEVAGHLVAAANGRQQPLRILALGTAGSFVDQEGMCIWLEEASGLLDGRRVRTFAGRVVATDLMHAGVDFAASVRHLHGELGFDAAEAVTLAERAHRGGGVARDTAYLLGWLRVRSAFADGAASLDELRAGKVGLGDLPLLRRLREAGLARPAVYTPSLARSLEATALGTSSVTSPPSFVTSLTRFEAT